MGKENISRRDTNGLIFGTAASVLLTALTGCRSQNFSSGGGSSGSGTGVVGLNTPSEILRNPFVDDALDEARRNGLSLSQHTEVDPPVISGRYKLSGRIEFPTSAPLDSGTFIWRNQTSDNRTDTDYEQTFQVGSGTEGEIIRGCSSSFAVYSILRVLEGGCSERAVFIVDGKQRNSGNVGADYIITPTNRSSCFAPSGRTLDLDLRGSAKTERDYKEDFGIMSLKED